MKVRFYCPCCREELVAEIDNDKVDIESAEKTPPEHEVAEILEDHNIIFGS